MDDVERRLFICRSVRTSGNLPYTWSPQVCGVHIERIRLAPHACPLALKRFLYDSSHASREQKHKTQIKLVFVCGVYCSIVNTSLKSVTKGGGGRQKSLKKALRNC